MCESVTGVYRLRSISYLLFKTGLPFFTSRHWAPLSHVRLCNPVDCNPPGCTVPGVFQARILECAISFSRESSGPGMKPRSPVVQAGATREATFYLTGCFFFFFNLIVNDLLKPIPMSQKNEICSSTSIFVFPSLPPFPRSTPIFLIVLFFFGW